MNEAVNKTKGRGLKIDNNVRYTLMKTMKDKIRFAWCSLLFSGTCVFSPYLFMKFHWPGGTLLFLLLPVSVVFLVISIVTLRSADAVQKALQVGNQSAFDEAMSKWNQRGVLAFGGYVLMAIVLFVFVVTAVS